MPELVNDGERRLIVAGRFRLVFEWLGDRWVHTLGIQDRGRPDFRTVAVTIEGNPSQDDPRRIVSPSYQDLQFQEAGAKLQALLVGQSGPHHFSAVFTVEQKTQPGAPGWPYPEPMQEISIHVDVADRCRSPIEFLASTYTVDATSGDLVDAQPTVVAWDIGPDRLSFSTAHDGPTRVGWTEAGRRGTSVQAMASLDPSTATQRFQYLWHWDPDLRW